jgi:hypothetical protein
MYGRVTGRLLETKDKKMKNSEDSVSSKDHGLEKLVEKYWKYFKDGNQWNTKAKFRNFAKECRDYGVSKADAITLSMQKKGSAWLWRLGDDYFIAMPLNKFEMIQSDIIDKKPKKPVVGLRTTEDLGEPFFQRIRKWLSRQKCRHGDLR